jgi:hypothetical protein
MVILYEHGGTGKRTTLADDIVNCGLELSGGTQFAQY